MQYQVESTSYLTKARSFATFAKSGIVALVLISVLSGFLIGQALNRENASFIELLILFPAQKLLTILLAVLLLASGSSGLNQIQERNTDAKMRRTELRPLPSGKLNLTEGWIFVFLTITVGLFLLQTLSPWLLVLGLAAIVFYNGLYTLWWKRHWPFAAVPGAIPGALPILMGFIAANNEVFHPAGIFLFFLLFFWQMPHFWVLAIKYREDYIRGSIPTLPVFFGESKTLAHITLWSLGYVGIALLAPLYLHTRLFYFGLSLAVSIQLIFELFKYTRKQNENWIRFFMWVNFSLIIYLGAAVIDLWMF